MAEDNSATNGANNDAAMASTNPIPEDDRKLFAGGLPQEASEADLKEYFAKFGSVSSVNLKMDQMTGRSRGFAFVVFDDVGSLESVLGQEHAIKGKKVAVKKAASKQGKIYVGKFTAPITEDEIKTHFAQFGNVVEIQRPVDRSKNNEPKNFCFITFDKEEPADSLLKKGTVSLNGMSVDIKKVTVKNDQGQGQGMRGGGRGGMRGGRGGGGHAGGGWGGHGGYDGWGYGGGWGDYGGGPPGPWGYGGGWGGYGGGWGEGGGYGGGGGGKMGGGGGGTGGGGMGGGGYGGGAGGGGRGRGSGRGGGRAAPY